MSLNCKLLPDKGYERLEPDVMKVASPVLRRGRTSNRSSLFGWDKSKKTLWKRSKRWNYFLAKSPRHGNNYLKTTLVEAAWAALRTKDTYLSAKSHNIAKRRGNKRAAVAMGHKILEIVYHILSKRETYKEIGPDAARSQKSRANEYSMIQKLEKASYDVQKVGVPT